MNIIVFLKQTPDETERVNYQDTGFMNESDKNVLMEALNLRDALKVKGTVTVLALDGDSAEKLLREALTYGVDRAILVEHHNLIGVDIRGAAYIMSKAIQAQGDWDLILCGRQAIDGDAAHMAGMTAGYLEIPQICYSKEIKIILGKNSEQEFGEEFEKLSKQNFVEAIRYTEEGDYRMKAELPALIMSIREENQPRYPIISDIMKTYSGEYQVEHLSISEFLNADRPSLSIREVRRFLPEERDEKECILLEGVDEEEKAKKLVEKLKEWNFIA